MQGTGNYIFFYIFIRSNSFDYFLTNLIIIKMQFGHVWSTLRSKLNNFFHSYSLSAVFYYFFKWHLNLIQYCTVNWSFVNVDVTNKTKRVFVIFFIVCWKDKVNYQRTKINTFQRKLLGQNLLQFNANWIRKFHVQTVFVLWLSS